MQGDARPAQDFTPYAQAVRGAADGQLRAILGLGEAAGMAWRVRQWRDDEPWLLEVELSDGPGAPLELELTVAEPEQRAWKVTEAALLSYRKSRDGQDPWESDAEARERLEAMGRHFVGAADAGWAPLIEAVKAHRGMEGVEDTMYRNLSWGQGGTYGTVRLGFRCNQDCSFCWQSRSWPEAPDEMVFRWIDEMAARGTHNLTLTGGEPTLNKRLPEMVERAARRHGMAVELQTNAIMMRKGGLAQRLADAGLTVAFVSYHSGDPAISDAMTRAPGTHKGTVGGIQAMLKAGIAVKLNCIVERQNYQVLPEHARDVLARFVDLFPDSPLMHVVYSHPCEYYEPTDWKTATVPLDDVQPYLLEASRALLDRGLEVNVVGFGCGFPPCLVRSEPRLMHPDTPERYAEVDVRGRTYAAVCDKCTMKPQCIGLRREYLDAWGDRGIDPFLEEPPGA